jgi:hypothetical protein
MKTSNKKMPPGKMITSSASKRTDQPEKTRERNKKRMRMDEEEDDEVEDKEVSKILQSLEEKFDKVIKAFNKFKEESWYQELKLRRDLISLLKDEIARTSLSLSTRSELKPLPRNGISETDPVHREIVQEKFDDLDACLENAINQSQAAQAAPAPSTYCLAKHYRCAQSKPRMAVRDGRMGAAPLALELLHPSFRIFTYWSSINPYPLPGSPKTDNREIAKDSFINVYQAANELLHSMPHFYLSHDDRLNDFQKALLSVFPENEEYEWTLNTPADQGLSSETVTYRIDMVYRYKITSIPLIFVEVKLEFGEGGNPFWQNHRLYQSYAEKNPKSRFNGAPVFFVQLCGMNFLHYDFCFS